MAVDITAPTKVAGWCTQSSRSGIWGAGGLASDGTSVFAETGDTTNTSAAPHTALDSEEVVRLSGMAELTRTAPNAFFPSEWST